MADRHQRRDALNCCPACAASVGADRRTAADGARRGWTWLALLGVVAALVPLAAMTGGGERALALAAPVFAVIDVIDPAPATEAPATVEWRESRAVGTPNAGRLEGGVRLPAYGRGFSTYNPATQESPGGLDRTWGTASLVREILDLGQWWARTHPARPPLGIGDLSREPGGPFTGPVVGHQSHQNGLDVDIRLVRRDGAQAPAGPDNYDRALTQAVVDRLVSRGATLVLIGPSLDLHGPSGIVMRWPAHDDHLHVRFADPDGAGS
jgi:hypothetical protein